MRRENQLLLNEQDRSNRRIAELEVRIAGLGAEIVRHQDRIREANNKEWELRNRIQRYDRDFDELEDENEELQQTLVQVRAALMELELEKEALERELHAAESEVQETYLFAEESDEARQKALKERDEAQRRLEHTLEQMKGVVRLVLPFHFCALPLIDSHPQIQDAYNV